MRPVYATDKVLGIYMFINQVNGKRYIGQSKDIYQRWYGHHEQARGKGMVFHLAIDKHGWDAFEWEAIERMPRATTQQLLEREQYWILHYRTNEKEHGYNRDMPLDCPRRRERAQRNLEKINAEGLNRGAPPASSLTRLRQSQRKKGIRRTEKEKEHLRSLWTGEKNPFYGKHHTVEDNEKANRSRFLKWFYNPKPRHQAVHLRLTPIDGSPLEYELIDKCAKRFHRDRKTLYKRIADQAPVEGYILSLATPDEVATLYERQRLSHMASICGTPTYW